MKGNIKAVIFDADGTILDTRELVYQAIQHVLTTHGIDMPPAEELAKFGGRPADETYQHFAPDHDSETLTKKHRAFQTERLDLFDAYEGLHDLLSALTKAGLKLGICTNRATNVIDLLDHIGIKEQFDAVIHADLVDQLKPHPEGLLTLASQLAVSIETCVMVGDTDADIGAGKAAGTAFTIGLTHGLGTREMLQEAGADYIVDHLDDILPLVT